MVYTTIVQTWVVPRAQARIRRQERREADLIELSALLEDALERTVSNFRKAVISQRHWVKSVKEAEDAKREWDPALVAEESRRRASETWAARDAVKDVISQISLLSKRLKTMDAEAGHITWAGAKIFS